MSLTQNQQILIKQAPSMALVMGICKTLYLDNKQVLSHLPFAFYPYALKRAAYEKLNQMHYIWHKLFVSVAADREFVAKLAAMFSKGDSFMERHLHMYMKQPNPAVGVACARVDYMGDSSPQLVEYNLMSVGLNGMSDRIQKLQTAFDRYGGSGKIYQYPVSRNQETICQALAKALEFEKLTEGIVVMVVHEKQFNYGDQADFKLEMLRLGRIVRPATMDYLLQNLVSVQNSNRVLLDGKPVDAFYFRTGYKIEHFPTERHWQLRETIERSNAIKLPSIDMIIINSKRMQSELAKREVLLKFLSEEQASLLLSVTGEIHDFDHRTPDQLVELIKKTQQQDYVLKPNREGGGNNFMGKKASLKLKQLVNTPQILTNYILMKKIKSQTQENYFLFEHAPIFIPRATTEYSTIGAFVYRGDQLLYTQRGGTLARIKREEDEEGGIAINRGAISGICVLDQA